MKTLIKKFIILLLLITFKVQANDFVIALAQDYPSSFNKEQLCTAIDNFVFNSLKQADTLLIIDGVNFNEIAKFSVLDKSGADSIGVKRRMFAKQLFELRQKVLSMPTSTDPIKFSLIQYPQLLKHLFGLKYDVNHRDKPTNVLTIGNVLYYDKEGVFDMRNSRYPNDAHLGTDEQHSVYGTSSKKDLLKNVFVHQVYLNNWEGDNYKTRINRFWSLFVKNQGGGLATFTGDLKTGFDRLTANPATIENFDLDKSQNKLEFYRATREVVPVGGVSEEANFLADGVQLSTEPPASTRGNLKVGIRWLCPCDVDLYAKSNNSPDYLYFGHQDSIDGHFFKDFTTSTAENGLEYIQFNEIDASSLDVKVNLYSGSPDNGVVTGIVRAELNGRVYQAPFEIKPTFLSSDSKWSKIDIKSLLKLT